MASLAEALEQAYEFGLAMGPPTVRRAENRKALPQHLARRADPDGARTAAMTWLRDYWCDQTKEAIMATATRNEPHWPALLAIATVTMEIDSFEERGRRLADLRMLRVADVARALEQAYRMGLSIGYNAEAQ